MLQAFFSLILLGGTGVALLGQCLIQVSGPAVLGIAAVMFFFGFGLYAQAKSLRG